MQRLVATLLLVQLFALNDGQCDSRPIKLGASLALSGKLAFIGNSEKAALEVATEDINARGGINGHKLELVIEDNQGDAKTAVASIEKLTGVDKVDLLFTAFTHIIEAVRPGIEKTGLVAIYHSSTDKPIQSPNRIFKDYGDAGLAGKFSAESAITKGYRNVVSFSEISDVCNIYVAEFKKSFEGDGRTIKTELSYNPGESDFRALFTKVRALKPDAISMCIWRDTSLVMKQMKDLGLLNIPTLHFHSAFLPAANTKETKEIFEENHSLSTWYGFTVVDANNAQKAFIKRASSRTGDQGVVVPDVATVYDDVMALAEATSKCIKENNVDSGCVASRLSTITLNGLAGPLHFGERRAAIRPVFWITVKDGEWQRVR